MAIVTEWVRYGADGHRGFLCHPERAALPLPAVVVIQEAWGVDLHMEDVARRFAGAGYTALAPDLFSRGGERPPALTRERMTAMVAFVNMLPPGGWGDPKARETAIAKLPSDEGARVGETFAAISAVLGDLPSFVPHLVAATRYLRAECPAARGQKIGSVGFCMGGGLSALLACHDPELAAAVIFYGPAPAVELIPAIACPILGFYGGADARINAGIPSFVSAMAAAGKRYEPHVYDGVQHAFFNDGRQSYDARATRDAFVRTLQHFRANL